MVAVLVTGGVGDFIVIARLLRDLCAGAGTLKIHVFSPAHNSASAWVFRSVSQVEALYDESFFYPVRAAYDSALVINQLVYHFIETANYHKIGRLAPGLLEVLKNLNKVRTQWDPYIERHPFLDGGMAHTAVALGDTRYSLLYSLTGIKSTGPALALDLDDTVAAQLERRYGRWITIGNGFDANFLIGSKTATKCYPKAHWDRLAAILRRERPDVALVQVGGKSSEPIAGIQENLLGRTSLPEVGAVIRRGLLHVDNEGGLVHVAASVGQKSVVLFGPTSLRYFGYPGNCNLSSGFCGDCWWSKRTWMEACPRGYGSALCMDKLEPDTVAAAILQVLPAMARAPAPVDACLTTAVK